MEAIREFLRDRGGSMPAGRWSQIARELAEMGWARDMSRPEEMQRFPTFGAHTAEKKTVYPWWIHGPTGEEVRGWNKVVRRAYDMYLDQAPPPPPSPVALRLVAALRQNPDLALEVWGMLSKGMPTKA